MMESVFLEDEFDANPDWAQLEHEAYGGTHTPSEASDSHGEDPQTRTEVPDSDIDSEEEYAQQVQGAPKRKKGGYDSRIEQILYENPDLPILIVDAGKSLESGGKYIVYTIRTGVCPSYGFEKRANAM